MSTAASICQTRRRETFVNRSLGLNASCEATRASACRDAREGFFVLRIRLSCVLLAGNGSSIVHSWRIKEMPMPMQVANLHMLKV